MTVSQFYIGESRKNLGLNRIHCDHMGHWKVSTRLDLNY